MLKGPGSRVKAERGERMGRTLAAGVHHVHWAVQIAPGQQVLKGGLERLVIQMERAERGECMGRTLAAGMHRTHRAVQIAPGAVPAADIAPCVAQQEGSGFRGGLSAPSLAALALPPSRLPCRCHSPSLEQSWTTLVAAAPRPAC